MRRPATSPAVNRRPITVALLAMPGVTASTLYGFHDAFSGVERDWRMLHGGHGESPLRSRIVSRDGAPLEAANGVRVVPEASFAEIGVPEVLCITDLAVPPGVPLGDRYDAEVAWIRTCHAGGAVVASACSGALLLARTGLLDGLDATSHWAYSDMLRREHPSTRWHPERGLVAAGPGQRIVMAGSGIAWHQLALALIGRFAGPDAAMQVARINLLDWNAASPLAYASLRAGAQADDPVVARCQEWAARHLAAEAPVAQMVALSGLPERSFVRRFRAATGLAPLDYVHLLRLEEAKERLEAGTQPVDEIAAEVGYRDPSFFRRLFRRKVAMTPAEYRRRFGALKGRVAQASGGF